MNKLSFSATQDFPNHEMKNATIGNVTVEMLRSKKAPNGEFLPAKVECQGKKLWSFKAEKEAGFIGLGRLIEFGNEYHIVLQDRGGKIHKIVPVADLQKLQYIQVKGGEVVAIGGRTEQELYALKWAIAENLKAEVFITPKEKALNEETVKFRQIQLEAERTHKEEERKTKAAAQTKKIEEILGRERIVAFSEDGKKCFGCPVVAGEWEILPSGTGVILVDSLEEKNPQEAFFVKKKVSGRLFKGSPKKVSLQKSSLGSSDIARPVVEAEGVIRVVKDGQLLSILNFSKENFQLLRKTGLNSGTLVAVGQPDEKGRYTVIKMKENECETVGQLPLA